MATGTITILNNPNEFCTDGIKFWLIDLSGTQYEIFGTEEGTVFTKPDTINDDHNLIIQSVFDFTGDILNISEDQTTYDELGTPIGPEIYYVDTDEIDDSPAALNGPWLDEE